MLNGSEESTHKGICLSYFSIVITKHYDKGKLQRKYTLELMVSEGRVQSKDVVAEILKGLSYIGKQETKRTLGMVLVF